MKNLHIQGPDVKFLEPYIEFVNKNFDPDQHLFAVLSPDKTFAYTIKYENIKYIYKDLKNYLQFIKLMYKSRRIFLHGLFNNKLVFLLFLQPWLLKKCSWIIWGGDLYRYRIERKTLKAKMYEFMRKVVIRNMEEILPIVKGDYELAKKWYKTKAKYKYNAKYVDVLKINYLNDLARSKYNTNSKVSILLGNSATKTNNHIEAIDKLKKYKNEDIKVVCPLSYGDMEYAKEVIQYGNDIFGEKFHPLTEFMDMKQYLSLLNQIDIGVFNNDRQQGLGNISSLLFLGKKIYMKKNTTMWHEYNSDFALFDVNSLDNEKYNDFIHFDKSVKKKNQIRMQKRLGINERIRLWKNIFNER